MTCVLGPVTAAHADDLLGLYLGAAYGQGHIAVHPGQVIPINGVLPDVDMTHSAYKAIVGIRPLPFLGAEVSYMDFSSVSSRTGQTFPGVQSIAVDSERASQKGESAFALLYLPVPVIDIYVKAGVSRITTEFNATYTESSPVVCPLPQTAPGCGPLGPFTLSHDTTDTGFAYGAGLQWKLGQWAVRGEYERLYAAGANPSLLSIGMTYWLE